MTFEEIVKEVTKEDYAGPYDLWGYDGVELIENEPQDQSRWSVNYRAVVKYQDKYYEVLYSEPATENQEEPFDPVVREVAPVKVTVTQYVYVDKVIGDSPIEHSCCP